MSALEELWHWLQGKRSRTEAGPAAIDSTPSAQMQQQLQQQQLQQQPGDSNQADASAVQADDEARIQRNWRYRAGPWQMK